MRGCLLYVSLFVACLGLARSASAAPGAADEGKIDVARTLGDEGVALYKQGRYQDALELFRRAEELHHAPTLTIYMARCQDKLGQLLKAKELYVDLLYEAEELPANPPPQYLNAIEQARSELESLEDRIPTLALTVRGPKASTALVRVDGAQIDRRAWSNLPLNPGPHEVVVEAPGTAPVKRRIALTRGTTKMEIEIGPKAPAVTPDDDGAELALVPVWVLFGFGGAALIVGAATGIVHLQQVDDLESRCNEEGHCPAADAGAAEETERLSIVSTTFFALGGAAVAAGAIVLGITLASGDDQVALSIGPSGFSLRGSF